MDCSLPGSSAHGIFQARIWNWVVISHSRVFPTQGSNLHLLSLLHWQKNSLPLHHLKLKSLSRVRLLATRWTAAHQAPPSMGFSKQEYWSGLPLPSLTKNPATAAAKSLQSCPTLCDPIDGSPTDSPVPEILQARTEEWVAISFSST